MYRLGYPDLTYQRWFTSEWIQAWQPLMRAWLPQQMLRQVQEEEEEESKTGELKQVEAEAEIDGEGIAFEDDETDINTTSSTPTSSTPTSKKHSLNAANAKLHTAMLTVFDTNLHTAIHTYLQSIQLSHITFATSTYDMAMETIPTYGESFTRDKHVYYSRTYLRW